jgi:carnitine-CoA ligase
MQQRELTDLGGGTVGGLIAHRGAAMPDETAVISSGVELTYGELDGVTTQVAAGLSALGLVPGDAVAIFLRNRIEWVTGWLGTARGGFVTVPVNTAYKGTFLEHALALTQAKVVITEAALVPALVAVRDQLPALGHLVLVDRSEHQLPAGLAEIAYEELLVKGDPQYEPPALSPHDVSGVALTSGTTGKSKGVVVSHLMSLTGARENFECMGSTSRDRLYTCLPMFHGAAQVNICLHAFYVGATVVLAEKFSASGFWEEIRAHDITMANALGSILPMLLAQPRDARDRDHRLRRIFAAPAPPDVLFPFEHRFGVHIVEGYGLTEIKNVTYNPVEGRKVGSIGKPTATTELQVQDDAGDPVPTGEIGEIVYRPRRANVMFSHYLDDPVATLATMRGMWWRTGDLGYVDADGFYYFVDRKKDALRRRGENISSYEVETVLMSFPGVVEAAAVATPSELGEDEVLAVIETEDVEALDVEALFHHCDERLPHFMVPRFYRLVPALPRTPTGKIQKAVLRKEGLVERTWDSLSAGHRPTRPT